MNQSERVGEPTIRDVARAAGVAPATAGRVLGGYGRVSAVARQRVQEAATALGYRPNTLGRRMSTGKTRTIGVVVADIELDFFARLVRGVADVARAEGYQIVLANTDEDPATERAAVQTLYEDRVEGLIISPSVGDAISEDASHLQDVIDRAIPVAFVDRGVSGLEADTLVVDNQQAAQDVVGHLASLGHRRIAILTSRGAVPFDERGMISANSSLQPDSARLFGYLRGMAVADLTPSPELIRHVSYSRLAAAEETFSLLTLPNPVTAIFATFSLLTMGALDGIDRAGARIPDDVSIVGFDDPEWATLVRPHLTVVAQPARALGAAAARLILARINGVEKPSELTTLPTTLIIRGSTGPRGGDPRQPPKTSDC